MLRGLEHPACRSSFFVEIKSFLYRGLKALYRGESPAKIAPEHIAKLERILTALDQSSGPEDMNLPGFHLY